MQNSKNSKEVQGTATAQQEQFNIANNKLFSYFGYSNIKKQTNNLLLGLVRSENFYLCSDQSRVAIFDFFIKSSIFLERAEKEFISLEKEVPFYLLNEIVNSTIAHDYKSVKKHFKETTNFFLDTDFANDKNLRSDVLYVVGKIEKYFKKVYKINNPNI